MSCCCLHFCDLGRLTRDWSDLNAYMNGGAQPRSQPCCRQSASVLLTTLIFLFFLTPVETSSETTITFIFHVLQTLCTTSFKSSMMAPRVLLYTELSENQIRLLMLQASRLLATSIHTVLNGTDVFSDLAYKTPFYVGGDSELTTPVSSTNYNSE